jgi:CheY-like chemotaxis protein
MKCVLYAEDEPDDVFFMELAFQKMGASARLLTVRDGAEAIAYLSGDGLYADRARYPSPNLVLLDLKMPIMNGFDVLKWIRTTPSASSLPVVVLTSSGNDTDKSRAALLGANGYLIKPSHPDKLAELARVFKEYWLENDHLSDESLQLEKPSTPGIWP